MQHKQVMGLLLEVTHMQVSVAAAGSLKRRKSEAHMFITYVSLHNPEQSIIYLWSHHIVQV